MVKKITLDGNNLTFEDDVQVAPRELDEVTKGSFSDHHTRHEEAGADEVTPALHAARHETGGADIVVPDVHAARHEDGGADELDLTGLAGQQYGRNLLQNASFQDSDGDDLPDFWTLKDTPTLAIATDTLRPELKGNQITITSVGAIQEGIEIAGSATNWLQVLPSTKYTISFYYKATAGDSIHIYIRSFNGAVQGTTTSTTLSEVVSTLYTITFTTDADADNLEIQFLAEADGDIVICSHPKLEEGAIATPYTDNTANDFIQIDNYRKDLGTNPTGLFLHSGENMLENPSFESYDVDTGLPVMWVLQSTPTLAVVADTLFPGRKGNQITMTGTGAGYEGTRITGSATNWLKVLPSTVYTFSVDYEVTAGDHLYIQLTSYNGAVAGTNHLAISTLASTTAIRYTFTFTTDPDADNFNILLASLANGDICVVSHPKLEQGAIATPYVHPLRDRLTVTTEITNNTPTPVIYSNRTKLNLTSQGAAFAPGAPTGNKYDGDKLRYRFEDDGTGRAITWNGIFQAVMALPATTTAGKILITDFDYSVVDTKWDCVYSVEEP